MIPIQSEKHLQQLLEKEDSHWMLVVKGDADKSKYEGKKHLRVQYSEILAKIVETDSI